MSIVVRAKQHPTGLRKMVGFYDEQRRYPGDVFEIKSKEQMGKWMEEVPGKGNAVSVGVDLKKKG
jgi:hypothetical protein